MPTSKKSIFESILAVQKYCAVEGLPKNQQGHQYKFRGIDSLLKLMSAALTENGLVIVPRITDCVREEIKTTKGVQYYTRLTIEYTVANAAGETIVAVGKGEALDPHDKGMGKAQSYAYKNTMFQLFAIPIAGVLDDTDNDQPAEPMQLAEDPKAQQNKPAKKALKPVTPEVLKWFGNQLATRQREMPALLSIAEEKFGPNAITEQQIMESMWEQIDPREVPELVEALS